MKTTAVGALLILATASTLFAQSPDSLQREAMKKADWWVGTWKGEAWSAMGPGRRDTTLMLETVRTHLDGTILLVEGVGRRRLRDGKEGDLVHHALAVLSYDAAKGTYRWQAWRTPGGIFTETQPAVTQNAFAWSMKTPRGELRYAAKLNDRGEWEEIGEFSSDGTAWHPVFGMRLSRVR